MLEKQIKKMALIERRIRDIISDKSIKGKIVIFVDPNKPQEGFIDRVECILINKSWGIL